MSTSPTTPLIKQLMEFGLSQKEASAYLALLELEIANVTELAIASDINRSSMYVVLESLKKKGLVSVSEDQKVQRYIAITPDMLLLEAEDRAHKAEDIKNKISDIVPELKALHKDTQQKPKVRVFEGKQGLIAALEDTLENTEKTIRISSPTKSLAEVLPEYMAEYTKKRLALRIKLRGILPAGTSTKTPSIIGRKDNIVSISPAQQKLPADMIIHDNIITYISAGKELAITIESREMAEMMKSLFDLAFEEAKRLDSVKNLISKYKESLQKYTQ